MKFSWFLALTFLSISYCNNSFGQNEYLRSHELNLSTAQIRGLAEGDNIIVGLEHIDGLTLCFARENTIIQKITIEGNDLIIRGLIEKDNSVHVFYGIKHLAKNQEGVVTFYKDNSRQPTWKIHEPDGNLLFAFKLRGTMNEVVFSKKENSLVLKIFNSDEIDSVKKIEITDKNVIKMLDKKSYDFIQPSTLDFKLLSSRYKAFIRNNEFILLINKYDTDPSKIPELTRIKLNFNIGKIEATTIRLPLKPKTDHTSYYLKNKLFTWGLNYDYFSLSIVDVDTLTMLNSYVYLKESDKIGLKNSAVFSSIGPPLTDQDWAWRDVNVEKIDETKVASILRNFARGEMVLKVTDVGDIIQLLFGTYQKPIPPYNRHVPSGSLDFGHPTSSVSFSSGVEERRKYFLGFLNAKDLKVSDNSGTFETPMYERERLDERIKDLYKGDEKIGGLGSFIDGKRLYISYILKKDKTFVIEELD